ncbi:hypothetical protein N7471_012509 [Penicillium samsonianum]|uniref:uncharacterized protein n=1 Tax=Penicillium samsonianum TaxID=1882272 RepID=UPI002548AF62|nr:uncharacterized protein N7471_012509 [Penicillium samsonianum]KAJ6125192.1 hypothetical protein N7471_012509 [Penicillium samsonianum]
MASFPISLRLLDSMKTLVSFKTFLISACILCIWKLLRLINSHISARSLNNFQADKSWDWKKEIVLITGGSNGIGARIVRKLSDREVAVVIWDIAVYQP